MVEITPKPPIPEPVVAVATPDPQIEINRQAEIQRRLVEANRRAQVAEYQRRQQLAIQAENARVMAQRIATQAEADRYRAKLAAEQAAADQANGLQQGAQKVNFKGPGHTVYRRMFSTVQPQQPLK